MKKRFFAGLLACLMVVGLLPLSMLLKPVSAKAYTVNGNVHVLESENMKAFSKTYKDYQEFSDENVDEYFSFYASKNTKVDKTEAKWEGENEYKSSQRLNFGGKAEVKTSGKKNVVVFKTSTSADVKIWWVPKNDNDSIIVYNNETYEKNALKSEKTANTPCVTDIQIKESGEYSLGASSGAIYIYKIEVTEETSEQPQPTETKYDVKVIDSASTDTETKTTGKVNSIVEGETLELSAEGDNFAYWENSEGYIVSREKKISFPVYYADTYTAVYKSDVTIEYLTPYGQTYKEFSSVDEIGEVEGPTRYGYEFVKWSKDLDTIKAEIAKGSTNVVVSPVYKEASETFDIEIVLDGASQGVVKYQINTVVNADASNIDNFAYWEDGNGNKLSYNAKYSFYANKDMVVKAVTSTTAVEVDVIIRTVKEPTTFGGDRVVMFEFNVPQGAEIKFAGVIADTNQSNLTFANAKYKRGGSVSLGILTYKYTLTKTSTMTDTLYVKPIIRYTIGGEEYEKLGTMVEL